jgi:septum formation protein
VLELPCKGDFQIAMIASDCRFILASNSPRRKQLFALGDWQFRVSAAEIDESILADEQPAAYVKRLAMEKAQAVVNRAQAGDLIVAADTTVVDGSQILGKPANAQQAVSMLRQLRGREHQVFTSLAIIRKVDGSVFRDFCSTDVLMRDYSDDEIAAYVASGDPLDKAGAYAIQHRGFSPAHPLQGCYANVVGLPLCHLLRTLRKAGCQPRRDLPQACQAALDYACPVFEMILEER